MQGIDGAPVLVAVVSDASNLSPQVHREIERALNRNRLIIPLRVQDILPSGAMEFLLSTCQWIDAYDPHFGAALNALTERVKNLPHAQQIDLGAELHRAGLPLRRRSSGARGSADCIPASSTSPTRSSDFKRKGICSKACWRIARLWMRP